MLVLRLQILIWALLMASCATPTTPESVPPSTSTYKIVGRYTTPGYAWDVVVKDSLAYIAQGEGGLVILNISDPENPEFVSQCQEGVRGYSTKIAMKSSTIYLSAGAFGVSVVDVADPLVPFATASNLGMKPARSMHVFGDYLFVAISELGVKIAEIGEPAYPDIRGGVTTHGFARAATTTVDSTMLLVACGEMGFSIHDITDMRDGFGTYPQIGWIDTPGYAEDVVAMDDQPYALVACGTAGLQIIDFSDTSHLRIVGHYSTGGYAKEVAYRNGRAYVTTELRGLQIISVEQVSSPKLIEVVPTRYALGLALDERHIYVADERAGLIIIAIPSSQ